MKQNTLLKIGNKLMPNNYSSAYFLMIFNVFRHVTCTWSSQTFLLSFIGLQMENPMWTYPFPTHAILYGPCRNNSVNEHILLWNKKNISNSSAILSTIFFWFSFMCLCPNSPQWPWYETYYFPILVYFHLNYAQVLISESTKLFLGWTLLKMHEPFLDSHISKAPNHVYIFLWCTTFFRIIGMSHDHM